MSQETGTRPRARVLYITYDGLLEPLGQSQVLQYLLKLSDDTDIVVMSFEKARDWHETAAREEVAQRLAAAGVPWVPLRYHKRPTLPATVFDIVCGCFAAARVWLGFRFQILHARSYVAASIALVTMRWSGAKFLFDMRGFWPDEKVDGNAWRQDSLQYRLTKRMERRLRIRADAMVSLTARGVAVMREEMGQTLTAAVRVIPTCANLELFKPGRPPAPPPLVIGYVGSVGSFYLFQDVARCFKVLQDLRPDVQFLVVNRGQHDLVGRALDDAGVNRGRLELISAAHRDVPGLMARMHATVFFIMPSYSKQASAPTRLAEFLAVGVPCLVNSGVGDMDSLLADSRTGAFVSSFDEASLQQGCEQLLTLLPDPDVTSRCRTLAQERFSLESGIQQYREIYTELLNRTRIV